MSNLSQFDADELLMLAVESTRQNQFKDAIVLLRETLTLEPGNARACYLLGAVHAQLGLYDKAIEEMQKAVEWDPGLHAAHFQLGLLHYLANRMDEARAAWSVLEDLGDEHYLVHFQKGLRQLAENDVQHSIQSFNKGIALNHENPALNDDIRALVDSAWSALEKNNTATPAAAEQNADNQDDQLNRYLFLSAYENQDDGSTH